MQTGQLPAANDSTEEGATAATMHLSPTHYQSHMAMKIRFASAVSCLLRPHRSCFRSLIFQAKGGMIYVYCTFGPVAAVFLLPR